MRNGKTMPLVIAAVWVAVIVIVVLVQRKSTKEAALVRLMQGDLRAMSRGNRVADVRCDADTLYISVARQLDAREAESLCRRWAPRFVEVRTKHMKRNSGTIVLIESTVPVFYARIKHGEITKMGEGAP